MLLVCVIIQIEAHRWAKWVFQKSEGDDFNFEIIDEKPDPAFVLCDYTYTCHNQSHSSTHNCNPFHGQSSPLKFSK